VAVDYVEVTKTNIYRRAYLQTYDTHNVNFFQIVSPIHHSYWS